MLKNTVLKYSSDLEVSKGFPLVCFTKLIFIIAAILFSQNSAIAIKPFKNSSLVAKLPDARLASTEEPELTIPSMRISRYERNAADGTLRLGKAKISSVYFNSASSFVLELENHSLLKILSIRELEPSIYEIVIDNSKFGRDLETNLSNPDFDLSFTKNDKYQTVITVKSKKDSKYEIQSRTVLDGLAYQFDLITKVTEPAITSRDDSWKLISVEDDLEEDRSSPVPTLSSNRDFRNNADSTRIGSPNLKPEKHQLNALIEDHKIYTISSSKSEAEEFLQTIDPVVVSQVTASAEFKHENFNRIDSSSLSYIAEKLMEKGLETDAARAYRRAITLDPRNLNARLGLAQTSSDLDEKITNYLLSLDDRALIEVGDIWLKEALEAKDARLAAKALTPYQFLVLKNPTNAEYRFRYAQILAQSGSHPQAAKRYLEAAALAKTQYLSGNKSVEGLLRGATEALITSLTNQGDYVGAAKYCGSYQNLGFNKFLNGKAIAGIIKEVEASRNPFGGWEG